MCKLINLLNNFSICLPIFLLTCLLTYHFTGLPTRFTCLPIYQSIGLSDWLFVYLSVVLLPFYKSFNSKSTNLSVYLFICLLSIYQYVCQLTCLPNYLTICLWTYLSTNIPVISFYISTNLPIIYMSTNVLVYFICLQIRLSTTCPAYLFTNLPVYKK